MVSNSLVTHRENTDFIFMCICNSIIPSGFDEFGHLRLNLNVTRFCSPPIVYNVSVDVPEVRKCADLVTVLERFPEFYL
jgi:hypothetical protein